MPTNNTNAKPYRMFDVHSHVMPGIDDGSRSLELSMEMLQVAYDQGVRDVICTSHGDRYAIRQTQYRKNLQLLRDTVSDTGLDIRLYPGCEIQYWPEDKDFLIEDIQTGQYASLNQTRYYLLEFVPGESPEEISHAVTDIKRACNVEIVLAHVERYPKLMADWDRVRALSREGFRLQINAYSLVKEQKESIRQSARRLLEEELVSFIGSDAHRPDHRNYDVAEGLSYIHEHCSPEYAEAVCFRNAEKLLIAKV